jgi:hypothetical protein
MVPVTGPLKSGGVGTLGGPPPLPQVEDDYRNATLPATELLRLAKGHSMYQCEVHLRAKGAHTLHKLLMAAHDPGFDSLAVSPELLHAPLPPSAADKLVLASRRTVRSEAIPATVTEPLCRSLPRYHFLFVLWSPRGAACK